MFSQPLVTAYKRPPSTRAKSNIAIELFKVLTLPVKCVRRLSLNCVLTPFQVYLRCAAKGYPAPTIEWNFNGAKVEVDNDDLSTPFGQSERGDLILRRVANESAGNYECVATNKHGEARMDGNLKVENNPYFYSLRNRGNGLGQFFVLCHIPGTRTRVIFFLLLSFIFLANRENGHDPRFLFPFPKP